VTSHDSPLIPWNSRLFSPKHHVHTHASTRFHQCYPGYSLCDLQNISYVLLCMGSVPRCLLVMSPRLLRCCQVQRHAYSGCEHHTRSFRMATPRLSARGQRSIGNPLSSALDSGQRPRGDLGLLVSSSAWTCSSLIALHDHRFTAIGNDVAGARHPCQLYFVIIYPCRPNHRCNSLHVNSMACGIAYFVNALGSYEATLAHV
jgi:hypothetical protein